jgi:hypothetical protein
MRAAIDRVHGLTQPGFAGIVPRCRKIGLSQSLNHRFQQIFRKRRLHLRFVSREKLASRMASDFMTKMNEQQTRSLSGTGVPPVKSRARCACHFKSKKGTANRALLCFD